MNSNFPHLPSFIFEKDHIEGACYSLVQQMVDFLQYIGVTSVSTLIENEELAIERPQGFYQVEIYQRWILPKK